MNMQISSGGDGSQEEKQSRERRWREKWGMLLFRQLAGESLSTGQYSLHVAVGPLPIGAAVRVSGAGAFEGARRVSAKVWRWVYAYVHRKQ